VIHVVIDWLSMNWVDTVPLFRVVQRGHTLFSCPMLRLVTTFSWENGYGCMDVDYMIFISIRRNSTKADDTHLTDMIFI
jgi:hypothetical protein